MSDLKYLIFFMALVIGVPIGYILAKKFLWVEKLVFFLFIFFTCEMIDINFVSMETYRGTSKGFEFGMVDIAMYILLLISFKRSSQYQIAWFPPGALLYLVYLLCSLISFMHADVFIYSAFEATKMLRMYCYFWIAYNYLQKEDQFETLMHSIGIIIFYIFFSVLKQKYMMGMFQAMGPFPHQNSLTMYISVLGSLSLSRVLNKKNINVPLWFLLFAMCAFCVLSTLSRAGLALFSLNCMIIFFISMLLKDREQKAVRKRKWIILIIMPLVASAALYKAADSIIERFTSAPEESKITRIVLAQAAMKMANENIFGVGLNNFAHKINDPYPYGSDIPIEISPNPYRRGLVETAYMMIAAETGWLNLGIFFCMLLYFYIKNILNLFRLKNSSLRYIAVALTGALTQIYLQTTLEWVIKQTNNFYQLMLILAIISVMTKISKRALQKSGNHINDDQLDAKSNLRRANCVTTI
jgi:hypothetical protein